MKEGPPIEQAPEESNIEGRLSQDEARAEAEMMQALLATEYGKKLIEEVGGVEGIRSIDARVLDAALKEVEDLKEAAAEEGEGKKALYRVGRFMHNIARVPGMAVFFAESVVRGATGGKMETTSEDVDRWFAGKLTDAQEALEILSKRARELAAHENKEQAGSDNLGA